VTGASLAGSHGSRLAAYVERLQPRVRNRIIADIPKERLWSKWAPEAISRAAALLPGMSKLGKMPYDPMFVLHDSAVAITPWPSSVDAVYAYEDASLFTFRVATRKGLGRLWDLPVPHWRSLEALWLSEGARWPGAMGKAPPIEAHWKTRRKDAELALADVIFVASAHTRASLEAVGCAKPIVVAPYGFPVEYFREKARTQEGPFAVLSVGTHDLRKGTPYLLEAWRRAEIRDAKLRLIGPMRLTKTFLTRYAGLFDHISHVPRSHLQAEYQSADVLAFPTLGDGFGLVMQEAMCCGTPVVTTRSGGGPECIRHGEEGWILRERDIEALTDFFRWAVANRERVRDAGRAARRRAEGWTGSDAGLLISRSISCM